MWQLNADDCRSCLLCGESLLERILTPRLGQFSDGFLAWKLIVVNRRRLAHLAKPYDLRSSPNHTYYTTNTLSDVSRNSRILTEFPYFLRNVSTSFHSKELKLILHSFTKIMYLKFTPQAGS